MKKTSVEKFDELVSKKNYDYKISKKCKNLGNRIIAISAPPGAGKTSCIDGLLKTNFFLNSIFDKYNLPLPKFIYAPGTTTRLLRDGEKHGFDFHFITDKQYFGQLIENKDFIVYFTSDPYLYAVDGKEIDRNLSLSDPYTIFIYNLNANQVPKLAGSFTKKPKKIFINAPSIKELEDRKFKRGGLSKEEIEFRRKTMRAEIKQGESIADKKFINKDFTNTVYNMTYYLLKDVLFKNARINPSLQKKIISDFKKEYNKNKEDILQIIK